MSEELSVLARQRAEDAALLEYLRALPVADRDGTSINLLRHLAEAVDRIEQLGSDLAEACHARDRLERELAEALRGAC